MSKFKDILVRKDLSLTLGADRSTTCVALGFVFLIGVFEFFYFRSDFRELAAYLGNGDNLVLSVICVGYILASLYLLFVYVLVTVSSKWYYKIPLIAIFALTATAQFGYHNAVGRFLIAQDFVSAFSATGEQKLDSIYAYTSFLALIPVALLSGVSVIPRKEKRVFGGGAFVGLLAVYCLFYVNVSFVNPLMFDRTFASSSIGNFWLAGADYLLHTPVLGGAAKKRDVVDAVVDPTSAPKNNIVFVFDESVRADHLSINGYTRKTTPFLEELERKQLLINWGTAVSSSTLSHTSYDAMISGATPQTIDSVRFHNINSMPTLFQYARSMNYKTHLFDGQMKRYWGGNEDDLNYIDNFVSLAEIDNPDRVEDWELGDKITNLDNERNAVKQWEIDIRIAKMVNEIFSGSTGNFIFIYKRGVHFPYEKNYPESEAIWKPIYRFKEQYEVPPADKIDAVKNSYDNSLRFNLDDFFRNLANDYGRLPNGTVIVYTSDHGESFFASGKAGHGGETREEAMVPFFVLGADPKAFDTGFKPMHCNIFTTLLDFMSVPEESRKNNYAVSLFKARKENQPPRFFNPPKGNLIQFED
ncbi:MAG: sulfatase-like hydrolase/transferase [Acidobacteria bacterium]|nr:sulfatase-like hydrolase/transferase [Acidobacteriota bacterium]MBK8811624.1 sulfatase-like hydrolase/transferase [Acidobacteriota bacterium]